MDSALAVSFKGTHAFAGVKHKLDCRARSAGANKKERAAFVRRALILKDSGFRFSRRTG
jgi:hypothetical protein